MLFLFNVMIMQIPKDIAYRNKKLLNAARGESCTICAPWCNHDCDTTVFCHFNEAFAGKGVSRKAHDYAGVFGCSACHDRMDRRIQPDEDYRNDEYFYLLRAYVRTIGRLIEKGIL